MGKSLIINLSSGRQAMPRLWVRLGHVDDLRRIGHSRMHLLPVSYWRSATLAQGAPFSLLARCIGMSRLDAQYYREEAKSCREAAERTRDRTTKEHWLEAERCWITLANQADVVTALGDLARKPK